MGSASQFGVCQYQYQYKVTFCEYGSRFTSFSALFGFAVAAPTSKGGEISMEH